MIPLVWTSFVDRMCALAAMALAAEARSAATVSRAGRQNPELVKASLEERDMFRHGTLRSKGTRTEKPAIRIERTSSEESEAKSEGAMVFCSAPLPELLGSVIHRDALGRAAPVALLGRDPASYRIAS